MDIKTIKENFEITLTKYKYNPNAWRTIPAGKLLGDTCDMTWTLKSKSDKGFWTKDFHIAYGICMKKTMTPYEISSAGWLLLQDDIFQWAKDTLDIIGTTVEDYEPPI